MKTCFLFLCLFAASCSTGAHRVINSGDKLLSAVTVQSGDKRFGHGYLAPNSHKSYHGSMVIKKSPKPVVSWKIDGTNDLKTMSVEMPNSTTFGKTVVFEIIGDNVKAYYD